jgi:hypothetical protein
VFKCVLPPGDNPIAVNKYIIYVYIYIFRKWDVGVWTGLSWLRIETSGGHL